MGINLLALDVGTSGVHCMVTDGEGAPLATKDGPIRYFTPKGASELTLEFDPQELLDMVGTLVVEALKEAGISGGDIKAVGVTSQRQGVVFVDQEGKELLVSPNIDLRAVFEGAALDEEMGPDLYRITGHYPSMLLAPSRLRWLQNNQPAAYERLDRLLTIAGWLAFRLTGNAACEPSLAAGAGLLEVDTGKRCSALLKKMGVPESLLPPLIKAGDVVGELLSQPAGGWGLRPGTPVTLGGADTQCGLLGMGLVDSGETGIVAGWSCAVQMLTTTPCYDDGMNAWVGCIPLEDLWVSEANLGDAGNAHRWLKDTLIGNGGSWEKADVLASSVPLGSDGVFSYLGTSPMSAAKAGLKRGGILFPTPMRYQKPRPGHMLKAFWESLAYSLKSNLGAIELVTGKDAGVLYLGGGMARSELMSRVTANVLDREIRRSNLPQVSARGAAVAAAVAAGVHDGMSTGARSLAPTWESVEPNPTAALEYQEHYQQWKSLYHRLQDGESGLQ